MREYLRAIAHARMAEDGIQHINKRQGLRGHGRSKFSLHWRDYAKGVKKKRRRRAA